MTGETGTLRYMAPEVVLSKPYTEKVDTYSFGIVVWTMATNTVAFAALTAGHTYTYTHTHLTHPRISPRLTSPHTSTLSFQTPLLTDTHSRLLPHSISPLEMVPMTIGCQADPRP